jgi:thioredoxin reductase
MPIEDVLIIGAGPAGLSAAIQLRRYGISPRLLERAHPGGLLRNANLVENYPGFPRGIAGRRLVKLILRQAEAVRVEITPATVTHLNWQGSHFEALTDQGSYQARCAVIASGTRPRRFDKFASRRIFYEVADLPDPAGAEIVIVGAGDAAFDYALNLAGRDNRVTILNRGEKLRCLPLLWERTQASTQIRYIPHTEIQKIQPLQNKGDALIRGEFAGVDAKIIQGGVFPVQAIISANVFAAILV